MYSLGLDIFTFIIILYYMHTAISKIYRIILSYFLFVQYITNNKINYYVSNLYIWWNIFSSIGWCMNIAQNRISYAMIYNEFKINIIN